MYVPWDPSERHRRAEEGKSKRRLAVYRTEYAEYYQKHAEPSSPAMRDPNPAVVLIPGLGMFSFGKSKTESRIIGEFYVNAIHVMKGAGGLGERCRRHRALAAMRLGGPGAGISDLQQLRRAAMLSEAYRIEYWALEEAKIRRQPAEKELSRQIALVVGGGSGIGREVALLAAERGAHVVVADRDFAGAERVAEELKEIAGKEAAIAVSLSISAAASRSASDSADRRAVRRRRYPREHRCALSVFAQRCDLRRAMGSDT